MSKSYRENKRPEKKIRKVIKKQRVKKSNYDDIYPISDRKNT